MKQKRTTLLHCNPQSQAGASQRNRTPKQTSQHEKTTRQQDRNDNKKRAAKIESLFAILKL